MASWPRCVFDVLVLCKKNGEEDRSHFTKATTNKMDIFVALVRPFGLRSLLWHCCFYFYGHEYICAPWAPQVAGVQRAPLRNGPGPMYNLFSIFSDSCPLLEQMLKLLKFWKFWLQTAVLN